MISMRLATTIIAFSGCSLLVGCGGQQLTSHGQQGLSTERLEACRTLQTELEAVSLTESAEEELMRLMLRAREEAEPCKPEYLRGASGPVEELIARHEGRQLELYGLMVEATLSSRFDDYANFCDIVGDTFTMLLDNIASLEETLQNESLTELETRQLLELRDLDLEAIDVFFMASERRCQ
ncbi:MAG: hypothetical protein ACI81R_000236 [Bradymonadia bacterium]|jgi:hypothetical protein